MRILKVDKSNLLQMQVSYEQRRRVTTAEFAAKFRSKYEVYTFLAVDVGAYLPQPECVTIYFLK